MCSLALPHSGGPTVLKLTDYSQADIDYSQVDMLQCRQRPVACRQESVLGLRVVQK